MSNLSFTCECANIKAFVSLLGESDVSFSLNSTAYHNNSLVTLEDIGQGDDALLCITNLSACCLKTNGSAMGNWFFPNGTRVSGVSNQWDFFRNRGEMVVHLNHRKGGVDGIYHCEIPDSMNDTRILYIGVYTATAGE